MWAQISLISEGRMAPQTSRHLGVKGEAFVPLPLAVGHPRRGPVISQILRRRGGCELLAAHAPSPAAGTRARSGTEDLGGPTGLLQWALEPGCPHLNFCASLSSRVKWGHNHASLKRSRAGPAPARDQWPGAVTISSQKVGTSLASPGSPHRPGHRADWQGPSHCDRSPPSWAQQPPG